MNNTNKNFAITPGTKIGALLDAFPQLEDILINMAPEFGKLRNPVLRRTVAKVATLSQVAKIGKVSLPNMINTLRKNAGITEEFSDIENDEVSPQKQPAWFNESNIVKSFDARPLIESGEQPISKVMNELRSIKNNQIYELITSFLPVPLIDKAKNNGFSIWNKQGDDKIVKTYFISKET